MHEDERDRDNGSQGVDVLSNEVGRVDQIEDGHRHWESAQFVSGELGANEGPAFGEEGAETHKEGVIDSDQRNLHNLEIPDVLTRGSYPRARVPEQEVNQAVNDVKWRNEDQEFLKVFDLSSVENAVPEEMDDDEECPGQNKDQVEVDLAGHNWAVFDEEVDMGNRRVCCERIYLVLDGTKILLSSVRKADYLWVLDLIRHSRINRYHGVKEKDDSCDIELCLVPVDGAHNALPSRSLRRPFVVLDQ